MAIPDVNLNLYLGCDLEEQLSCVRDTVLGSIMSVAFNGFQLSMHIPHGSLHGDIVGRVSHLCGAAQDFFAAYASAIEWIEKEEQLLKELHEDGTWHAVRGREAFDVVQSVMRGIRSGYMDLEKNPEKEADPE